MLQHIRSVTVSTCSSIRTIFLACTEDKKRSKMSRTLVLALSVILHLAYVRCEDGPNYRVIGYTSDTSNFLQDGPDGTFKGFIWDMMNALKDTAGFSFTMTVEADGIYGAEQENQTWNGMVGKLINNEVDIIAADFTISPDRETVMDFSMPFMYYHVVRVTQPNATLDGIKYAVVKDGADYTYLQGSVDPVAQAIWANIQANAPTSLVKDDAEGLALVRKGNWAYVTEDAEVAVAIKESNGQFVINGPHLQRAYYGLGVRLGDKLSKSLSINIAKVMESGQMQQILQKWDFVN